MKRTFLVAGGVFLFVVAGLLAQPAMTQPELYFHNNFKTVRFPHEKHAFGHGIEGDCSKCHPPFKQKFDDAVSIKDLAHSHCKSCHQQHANHGAPNTCLGCHTGQEPPPVVPLAITRLLPGQARAGQLLAVAVSRYDPVRPESNLLVVPVAQRDEVASATGEITDVVVPVEVPAQGIWTIAEGAPPAPLYWTCSMHYEVNSPQAGDCPKCGMNLIPVFYWTCSMHPEINAPKPGSCPKCGMYLSPATEPQVGSAAAETPALLFRLPERAVSGKVFFKLLVGGAVSAEGVTLEIAETGPGNDPADLHPAASAPLPLPKLLKLSQGAARANDYLLAEVEGFDPRHPERNFFYFPSAQGTQKVPAAGWWLGKSAWHGSEEEWGLRVRVPAGAISGKVFYGYENQVSANGVTLTIAMH